MRTDTGNEYGERIRGTDAESGYGERIRGTDTGNGYGERIRGTDTENGYGEPDTENGYGERRLFIVTFCIMGVTTHRFVRQPANDENLLGQTC